MVRHLIALCLCGLAAVAQAAIVEEHKPARPKSGIAVPKSKAPFRLECWLDGRRQIVEAFPPQLPPAVAEPSTRVVVRGPDGTTTIVVVPGAGASGCLPLR